VVGRKRHIATDTLGLIHALSVQPASMQDRDGAKEVLAQLDWERYPRLETVWADGAYQGALEDWAADVLGLWLQIVHKLQGQRGFVVLAKRWIVERTFAWLGRYRRLSKDYEANPRSSEAWIRCAMIHLMARRLAAG
jgi:putative transposase